MRLSYFALRFAGAPLVPHDGGEVSDRHRTFDEGQATGVVGNGDVKHFLYREDEFHHGEAVDVQIFEQPGITMDLLAQDSILLGHQVPEPELDLAERRGFSGLWGHEERSQGYSMRIGCVYTLAYGTRADRSRDRRCVSDETNVGRQAFRKAAFTRAALPYACGPKQ
jgi:hypothetical protein